MNKPNRKQYAPRFAPAFRMEAKGAKIVLADKEELKHARIGGLPNTAAPTAATL